MKLSKRKTKVNGKEYDKYLLTMKKQIVEDLEWKHGDEIKQSKQGNKIVLERDE